MTAPGMSRQYEDILCQLLDEVAAAETPHDSVSMGPRTWRIVMLSRPPSVRPSVAMTLLGLPIAMFGSEQEKNLIAAGKKPLVALYPMTGRVE